MDRAERLARYADELSYQDLDEETIRAVELRLIDAIACAFAAMPEDSIENRILPFLRGRPGDEARIIGGGATGIESATLANSTLIRYVDWNDAYQLRGMGGHPSDNFGSVLSVADMVGASGQDVILAAVLGYEIQCQMGDRTLPWHVDGLDHTTYGLLSSALSTGKLLGLTQQQMVEAMSMAMNNLPLRLIRNGEISDFKGMAFGNAARNAVWASMLAQAGVTGPKPIFEGKDGFIDLLTQDDIEIDIESFGGPGNTFKIHETSLKPHACWYHGQSPVDAALDVHHRHQVVPGDIISVKSETYEAVIEKLDDEKWNPRTRGSADHSVPWLIAHTLITGESPRPHHYRDNLMTPEIASLMQKIDMTEDKAFTGAYGPQVPHRLTVTTTDGSVYESYVQSPKGHPGTPMPIVEVEDKFRSQYTIAHQGNGDDLLEWLWALDEQPSLDGLFQMAELDR